MAGLRAPFDLHSPNLQILDPGDAGDITVDRNPAVVLLVSGGAETRTLNRPTLPGISVLLQMKTDGGDITLTVTGGYNEDADTTFTFDDPGEFALFTACYDGTNYFWRLVSSHELAGISQTEAAFLSGVTAGTLTASKAMVVDANDNLNVGANTAAAFELTDGTTDLFSIDTRNTLKNVHAITITGTAITVATESAAHINASLNLAAKTVTYTGTTTTTSSFGVMLYVGVPTFTCAGAATLSAASSVHINAVAAAGGSLTITAAYMISTSVADCFLTNAGVWTDTSSVMAGKKAVMDAEGDMIERVIREIKPRTWQYKKDFHGDDGGIQRIGIVAEELPEQFRTPGGYKGGLSAGVSASFALAAIVYLQRENDELKRRLESLESKL